jgi:hypothetical protein
MIDDTVAEVVQQHFGNWLAVEPKAPIWLYVHGSDVIEVGGSTFQNIEVCVRAVGPSVFRVADQTYDLFATWEFASKDHILKNYPPEKRRETVRESVYAVLSDFLGQWQKAVKDAEPKK